jgi:hypothetical protein
VALTRAIRNVYLINSDAGHPLLRLLDIAQAGAAAKLAQVSSLEDWQKKHASWQGKQEQADAIERLILKTRSSRAGSILVFENLHGVSIFPGRCRS